MKKVLTHNGKTFNLKLEFNVNAERHPGGKVEHLLSSYEVGEGYKWNKSWMIDNSKMKGQIESAENEIREYADGKKLTPEEKTATLLGFE